MGSPIAMIDVLQIHPNDNVCIAVRPLHKGARLQCAGRSFELPEAVPLGAKIALAHMKVIQDDRPSTARRISSKSKPLRNR